MAYVGTGVLITGLVLRNHDKSVPDLLRYLVALGRLPWQAGPKIDWRLQVMREATLLTVFEGCNLLQTCVDGITLPDV